MNYESLYLRFTEELNDKQKKQVELFYNDASNLIKLYIKQPLLPLDLMFIAEEIAVQRFRRIGTEAVSQESVDVVSSTFNSMNVLAEYTPILDAYMRPSANGKLRTL